MKKTLLFTLLLLPALLKAQTVPVDSFENWTIKAYDDLNSPWISSNISSIPAYGISNAKKVAGFSSNNALRLETYGSGGDTLIGYVTNTMGDPFNGEGGMPYSQQPTAINGYWRYNIPSLDTAFLIVVFKKNGVVISEHDLKIKGTGSQTTFAPFSFPLNVPVVPDSVIIVATSSNVMSFENMSNASWLELDGLNFSGPGVTQTIVNGDFEGWTNKSNEALDKWDGYGNIKRTTDKYSGTYAAKLVSEDDGFGSIEAAEMSRFISHSAATTDTLSFYYKYSTPGSDSAYLIVMGFNGNIPVGIPMFVGLPPAANYTNFKMPISITAVHDSLYVNIYSSGFADVPVDQSTLIIDQMEMRRGSVGIGHVTMNNSRFSVYPNPAVDVLTIASDKGMEKGIIYVMNGFGQVMAQTSTKEGQGSTDISVAHLAPGNYRLLLRDVNGNILYTGSVTKK